MITIRPLETEPDLAVLQMFNNENANTSTSKMLNIKIVSRPTWLFCEMEKILFKTNSTNTPGNTEITGMTYVAVSSKEAIAKISPTLSPL